MKVAIVYPIEFGDHGHVGWWAHVGGIVAGLAFTPWFKRRSERLLGPPSFKGPWET